MEVFFVPFIVLFVLAVLTFVLIVRDVLPLLDSGDRTAIRSYWDVTVGFVTWRRRDRATKHAWNEHARRFPKSRKRLLFAALLIAAAVSLMVYPLWYAFRPK